MPRPNPETAAFSVDGLEVNAPAGMMLADAAKFGDVEIPVFCYEPKLGPPVGACRMCLVEIEGIPKLQTACSTPVKDGMVVFTQTDRVKQAQEAVLEFLLINHPLDCPVCDAGGECPLQDITFGWGPGRSRFIEPKRHFVKPLALSPLIAIDRERCILCYRCVRFSQEVAEDYQLILEERGADTFVSTFDGHPYVAPFSGNIIELCPVGALTSQPYRFRARPWDIEGSGSVCTLCPAQCNVEFTVRDERVLRVMARDHHGVDDGWLCDKGRFAYQSVHVDQRVSHPLVRVDGELVPVSWDRALDEAAAALSAAGSDSAAIAGGETTNEEGWLLQELVRGGLGSANVDSRFGGMLPRELHAALHAPALQATVPDLEFAHAVLVLDCEPVDDAPILDLRIRKGVRRNGVKLAVATSRPSSLDANAAAVARFAPGAAEAFCAALNAAVGGHGVVAELAAAAGAQAADVLALAQLLTGAGDARSAGGSQGRADIVIVYGERLTHGARGEHAARALLNVAGHVVSAGHDGSGLLELPAGTNGRGLREAGMLPNAGPGLAEIGPAGLDTGAIGAAAAAGALSALYLLHVDPLRDLPSRRTWRTALQRADSVIAHAEFLSEGLWEHATVVFPSESYAEKEGTITHPDGRVQRLRPAIARPDAVRAEWNVLADLSRRLGHDPGILSGPMASAKLFEAVPFYAGITLDELGGRGLRWPARPASAAWPAADGGPFGLESPQQAPTPNGSLRLGRFRSIWAAAEVELSPALKFLRAHQRAELSPADARRLGLAHGDRVTVGSNGSRVSATVALRSGVPEGTVFLEQGIAQDSASELDDDLVEVSPA
ncbi:MAG: NADH-ubiquinone oxidoreductase chain G [uncultured Solirubrobacteraceae bacterium]|uniref:NADH-quinone oxidoreductase n=1 Tax=uncultured Solirubrobacteraceae bacterium TaxID=1162706 RepID=A0A6J4S364_9ACTN|nr:MAG: NADH-ubiquinone oxidoreductase chain G [uncultured Solirubrobacteraceae bacterium]